MFFRARSVFVFLFCCWPLGCMAMCESSEVSNALARGDTAAARRHAKTAGHYQGYAMGFGLIGLIVVIVWGSGLLGSSW